MARAIRAGFLLLGTAMAAPCVVWAEPVERRLLSPVASACVSSSFGPRVVAGLQKAGGFHDGIDMPAAAGAPVRAVADGQVVSIRRGGGWGLYMIVRHDGFEAIYAHLGRVAPAFATGKRSVTAGERLAVAGRSGVVNGAHLHFGIRVDGEWVDPAPRLGLSPCG